MINSSNKYTLRNHILYATRIFARLEGLLFILYILSFLLGIFGKSASMTLAVYAYHYFIEGWRGVAFVIGVPLAFGLVWGGIQAAMAPSTR